MTKKRKKIIIYTSIAVLIFIPLSFYILLFTPPGNMLLTPLVESKINENLKQKINLKLFRLTTSYIKLEAELAKDSTVECEGTYSLFDKSFDINYKLNVANLADLEKLITIPLSGPISTSGNAKGDLDLIQISGTTDLAEGLTDYKATINKNQLTILKVHSSKLKTEKLMFMNNLPLLCSGTINIDADFQDLNPESLKGTLVIDAASLDINHKLMKENYQITLPETKPLKIFVEASPQAEILSFILTLDSNIISLKTDGTVELKNGTVNANYDFRTDELALLEPLVKQKLQGPLSTKGTASGNYKASMLINGKTDIAESDTNYKVTLEDLKPASAVITMKHAKLAKILQLTRKPIYADASIDLNANIATFAPENINGDIKIILKEGKTFPEVLNKEVELENVNITFAATTETKIVNSISTTKTDVQSSICSLQTKKTVYDLNKKELNSDFNLFLPDLDKLFFVTKRHLKGEMTAIGNLKKNEQDLIVDAKSNTLGGDVTVSLKNDDLIAVFKKVMTTKLCKTLLYPQVFEAELNGIASYNIKIKKGNVKAELLNGQLTENKLTKLIKSASKYDITKEVYPKTTLDALINDKIINANIKLTSKDTNITAKNAIINLDEESIDTTLIFLIKKQQFDVKVKGSLKDPNLSLKTKKLIKQELKKLIDKKVPDKYKKDLNKILDFF